MKENFKNALEEINRRLEGRNIKWAIFGSMNLLLQGLPMDPGDIDVLTDEKGAYEIEKALMEYSTRKVKYCSDGNVTSHFGALEIAGVKAEIVGNYTSNKDMQLILDVNDRTMVSFANMQIPCLPLEKELIAYQKGKEIEKFKLIQEYLNNQN